MQPLIPDLIPNEKKIQEPKENQEIKEEKEENYEDEPEYRTCRIRIYN